MFPKKGKFFPDGDGENRGDVDYAKVIAAALKRDLGVTHQAAKIAMKWTGANERTVKNWLAARHGPCGKHLIDLLRHSDAVLDAALRVAGRTEMIAAISLVELRHRLAETVAQIDELMDCGSENGGEGPLPSQPE